MPAEVTFTLDTQGIGEYLRTSGQLRAALAAVVAQGVAYARSIAPVGRGAGEGGAYLPRTGRRPGDYRNGIVGEVAVTRTRMVGRVLATDFKAGWIEYGSEHMPKYRVLGRTTDHTKVGG
jgi:hypothetical protein